MSHRNVNMMGWIVVSYQINMHLDYKYLKTNEKIMSFEQIFKERVAIGLIIILLRIREWH